MIKRVIFTALILLFGIAGTTSFVLAHGNGVSHEETKDGYFIDIGRDAEFPVALEQMRFDFTTYPEELSVTDEEIFTDVWVRISQDRELFFSGGINKPVFGVTGFTYMFPKEGSYEVLARFQKDGDTVVETSFVLDVLPPTQKDTMQPNPYLAAAVGFIFGFLVMFFISRKKK